MKDKRKLFNIHRVAYRLHRSFDQKTISQHQDLVSFFCFCTFTIKQLVTRQNVYVILSQLFKTIATLSEVVMTIVVALVLTP